MQMISFNQQCVYEMLKGWYHNEKGQIHETDWKIYATGGTLR